MYKDFSLLYIYKRLFKEQASIEFQLRTEFRTIMKFRGKFPQIVACLYIIIDAIHSQAPQQFLTGVTRPADFW